MKIYCPQTEKFSHYHKFVFPAGEMHIVLRKELLIYENDQIDIEFNFSKSEDIFELLLLANTLHRNNIGIGELIIPYMPFGQADRVNEVGECFSLRLFCDLINIVVQPSSIVVYDPHSDVTPALLNNCRVLPQWDIIFNHIISVYDLFDENTILVSPDAGASKKIYKLAQLLDGCPVIECSKHRDTSNGKILSTEVHCGDLSGKRCLIVDDQVVGGRTFVEIAKILRSKNAESIILCTTNGIYSSGLEPFEGLIDQIYNRKGRVK